MNLTLPMLKNSIGKVKALLTSPLGLCVGGRAGGTTCIGLLRVCGFGFNFENEIITCAWYLQVNAQMTVKRALGIIQVGSRMCAWLDTSKEKNTH